MLTETSTLEAPIDYSEAPRALVTGAASGIGEACARRLLQMGYYVVGMDLRKGYLEGVDWCIGSVAEPKHCDRAAEISAPEFVIHSAGIAGGGGSENMLRSHQMPEAEWHNIISVDLTGAWNVARAVLARSDLKSVVMVSSIRALFGSRAGRADANYSAAKGGVVAMTRALAVEYAPGVRFNAICPGPTDSPMTRRGLTQEAILRLVGTMPIRRLVTADEVAEMCIAVGLNGGMTGSVVIVDGGYSSA